MSTPADDQNEKLLQDAEQVVQSVPACIPRSHREQRLLEVLESVAPLPLGVKDIAEHLGEPRDMVRAMLQYLALFGEVRRVRTGMFTHVPPDRVMPPERPTARPQRIPSTDE